MQVTELTTPGAVRRAVREKTKELLLGQTGAGANVFISRAIPNEAELLPVINIYTGDENVENFDESPKRYRRNLQLVIEVGLVGDDDDGLDLERDKFGDVIEAIMEEDETLDSLVDTINLVSNELRQDAGGESPSGKLSLTYDVRYFLYPTTKKAVHDFHGADVDWRLKRPEELPDSVDAEDTIDIES